ncbi:hypothetical protein [Aurantimonas sp. VKM B-3413]|uniref:hypothetical protein n=1 Tax=Aurantimonas sp. VKM B-3413 TaxID=2779401 RepID=UPI001E55E4B7|nr:hypothetical protein [Aurantimonas sp. VKM B-3413]MCB8835961.1 hypothetical protein [Aurantimonas sp. VKM B-3413]
MEAWRDAATRKPPRIPDDAFERFAQIRSIEVAVYPHALLLRMMSRHGDVADVLLNPVLARDLAAMILTAGQSAGWLDEKGTVVIPEFDPLPDDPDAS